MQGRGGKERKGKREGRNERVKRRREREKGGRQRTKRGRKENGTETVLRDGVRVGKRKKETETNKTEMKK